VEPLTPLDTLFRSADYARAVVAARTTCVQGSTAMSLKLYYHPLSTFSRRVLIAFVEKQIPHELTVVDMAARRHREQPYLSLNPYGRVPTLEEDGFVLFESTAILNYLEATRPTPPLVPADARGRALVKCT